MSCENVVGNERSTSCSASRKKVFRGHRPSQIPGRQIWKSGDGQIKLDCNSDWSIHKSNTATPYIGVIWELYRDMKLSHTVTGNLNEGLKQNHSVFYIVNFFVESAPGCCWHDLIARRRCSVQQHHISGRRKRNGKISRDLSCSSHTNSILRLSRHPPQLAS